MEQGEKLYGAFHGGALDTVSLTGGNLFFHAPLFTYSQRGGELSYPIVLRYNNKSFSLFQRNCPPPPPGSHPPCPMDLIFGPPSAHNDVSHGSSVTVGFEGLPGVGSNSLPPGINTGLSFDGKPIFVLSQPVLTPDGALHQLVKTDSGLVTLDGSGYFAPSNGPLTDAQGSIFSIDAAGAISVLPTRRCLQHLLGSSYVIQKIR